MTERRPLVISCSRCGIRIVSEDWQRHTDQENAIAAAADVLPEVMEGASVLVGVERWVRLRDALDRLRLPA